jgi:hypothetical protein
MQYPPVALRLVNWSKVPVAGREKTGKTSICNGKKDSNISSP